MDASVTVSADDPYEMNGSGMPVSGSIPIIAPMLMSASTVTHVTMPTTSMVPNVSGAPRATAMPRRAKHANAMTTSDPPTAPTPQP